LYKNNQLMKSKVLFLIGILQFAICSEAATYTVTTTADSGPGSLREAIGAANVSAGGDNIYFNIPTADAGYDVNTGVWTIMIGSSLPMIQGAYINIDATSQTTNQGNYNPTGPEIRITTSSTVSYPFIVVSPGNTIRGFIISGFEYGILLYNNTSHSNTVAENYLGLMHDGITADPNQYGIGLGGATYNNSILNNKISGNTQAGIAITESGLSSIRGNFIGTDHTGNQAVPNLYGIAIQNGQNIVIGGSGIVDKNLISGNIFAGIIIDGLQSQGNIIYGNYIGTDLTTTSSIPNDNGIILSYASSTTIGGNTASLRNIISGNTGAAIVMNGTGTRLNSVIGNYIGTDSSGTIANSNYSGIVIKSNSHSNIIGGSTSGERNIISANIEMGVYIEASDSNVIIGNYIGPDVTGMAAFKTGDTLLQANGVEFNTVAKHNRLGGYSVGERNIVSGNRVYGMVYYGNTSHNPVIGNYIGVDVTGNNPLPNATGICVDGGSNHNPIINNVLSGNISYGIFIVTNQTFYNEMKGNLIGTNASGTDTVPNDAGLLLGGGTKYNIIGGDLPEDRNIISGNRYGGIEVSDQYTTDNVIKGNYIGTDISGTYALPNQYGIGLTTYPKKNTIDNNLISGNKEFGLLLFEYADSNIITRNAIGTASDMQSPLGNGIAGIIIWGGSSYNIIGQHGAGNIIAYHDSLGLYINDANTKHNTISGNSFFSNNHMGIDLAPEGPNYNDGGDSDDGPNALMNHPVVQHAAHNPNNNELWAYGQIDTQNPLGTVIEIFLSDGNPYDRGEGKVYLGNTIADASGNWAIITSGAQSGDFITATATDITGNTSEFCPNFNVTTGEPEFLQPQILKMYPNPTSHQFYVESSKEIKEMRIYTISGIEIDAEIIIATSISAITLPTNIASGNYTLSCTFICGQTAHIVFNFQR
jgi:parallel beta-helix repeat protein